MNVLEFKNVTKSYRDGNKEIEALKETNFKIEEGQFIAIIGPSGSGKSTFLTLAGGLQTPSKGQIIINGKDYTNLAKKKGQSCDLTILDLFYRHLILFHF